MDTGLYLTLDMIGKNEPVRVKGFKKGRRKLVSKLIAIGIGKGSEITIVRYAPLGDPIQIKVQSANYSLRKDEAGHILVRKIT